MTTAEKLDLAQIITDEEEGPTTETGSPCVQNIFIAGHLFPVLTPEFIKKYIFHDPLTEDEGGAGVPIHQRPPEKALNELLKETIRKAWNFGEQPLSPLQLTIRIRDDGTEDIGERAKKLVGVIQETCEGLALSRKRPNQRTIGDITVSPGNFTIRTPPVGRPKEYALIKVKLAGSS